MTRKVSFESAAVVTIRNPGCMTSLGRKAVAKWLRKEAEYLEKHWNLMAPRYTARFRYAK